MGKLIVVEGLDGSGKATQAKLLAEKLKEMGKDVIQVSFPDYDSDSSALVKMYLSGKFGSHAQDVDAYAASAFYAVDRFASYKTSWQKDYENGRIIIADRYTTSNGVHQCSKLEKGKWDDFVNWLYDFEYNKMGIPAPDCVIYLNMSLQVSQKLLMDRYHGDESRKDIHEKDTDYLAVSRQAARFCAEKGGWKTIRCDDGTQPYTPQQISRQVTENILEIL